MQLTHLDPILDETVERKSSVSQHKDLLSILVRGEWCPIVFKVVEGVECGKIKYRRMALPLRNGLNYTLPVGTCQYTNRKYILTGQDEIKLKKLPSYYGNGLYESHERKNVILNIGKNALGVVEKKILRVGKDYVVSKKILDPIE